MPLTAGAIEPVEGVLRERGWNVERELLENAQRADPYFGMENLLRRAVSAGSLDDWREELAKLLARKR